MIQLIIIEADRVTKKKKIFIYFKKYIYLQQIIKLNFTQTIIYLNNWLNFIS